MPPPADRTSFSLQLRAEAADIDELGHVNNAVYLRWVQAVAVAHWQAVAAPEHRDRFIWVVSRHEIDYRAAVLEGETVTATTWVGTPSGARFDRHVEIIGEDGRLRARALTIWALLNAETRRLLRVPAAVAAPFLR
ncbi:acyl-CoA thioester hydrolase [Polymorphobacter multimanifer]|uniref:Acyl-CoA thioester hydrolase n=1 Tax=Polymorphobacter multimanifer TaxID=1070431 RepID=A0A841L903_9SPHN|nr:acyl-CoA thioesterase [Polymorphobacter multimanifer]MBB6229539.1 acyl-CoA thioester hydrolase [Polymorphobacter multimanifer]